MNSFCQLSDDSVINTKFILKGINMSQLDNQYVINELQDIGINHLVNDLNHSQDTLTKITSTLESIGVSKSRSKPFDTILMNDELNIRLFISPNTIPCNNEATSPIKALTELRKANCWYCRNSIPQEWHPLGIPIKHKVDTNKVDCFDCEGVFCSFNCCVAYLNEHSDYRFKDSSVMLLMMYRKVTKCGKTVTSIVPAPSWKLLKEYGGHLSIEDYRKCIQQIDYKSMQQLLFKNDLRVISGSELFVEV